MDVRSALFGSLLVTRLLAGYDGGDANLRLELEGALGHGPEHRATLYLDLPVRAGAWPGTAQGWTFAYAQGRFPVAITVVSGRPGEASVLELRAPVRGDFWVPAGEGRYRLELAADGSGTFTGDFRQTGPARLQHWPRSGGPQAVPTSGEPGEAMVRSGVVTVRSDPAWPRLLPGVTPAAAGEHPRLVFRLGEREDLRRFVAEDAVGRSMLARLREVTALAAGKVEGDKFTTWPAIGHGTLYQLSGEVAEAEEAWTIVERTVFANPAGPLGEGVRQDIHHAPRLQGLALVYDLCHEAWDAGRRDRVARELAQRVRECDSCLFEGKRMSGLNQYWWSNHNGIRAAAVVLGALALLDEVDGEGAPYLPEARALIDGYGLELRGWLEFGIGRSGWCPEGNHYKFMTMRRGWSHAVWALRCALGQDLTVGLDEHLVVGYLLEADPGQPFPHVNDYDGHALDGSVEGGHLRNALFNLHWPLIPGRYLPGVKAIAEAVNGPQGAGDWGIAEPMLGPYAIAGWPRSVAATTPGDGFPWLVPDPVHGHLVVRSHYRDGDDILLVLNQASFVLNAYHYERVGVPGDLRLWGFGQRFAYGRCLPVVSGVPFTDCHGPVVLAEEAVSERRYLVHCDLSECWLGAVPRERRKDAASFAAEVGGIGLHVVERQGSTWVDFGVRGRRSILVDGSGACGAPLLLVIRDRLWREGGQELELAFPFPRGDDALPMAVDGLRATLGDPADAHLALTHIGAASLGDGLTAHVEPDHWLVLTVQRGAAPAVTVQGEGAERVVEVGGLRLGLRDDRLVVQQP